MSGKKTVNRDSGSGQFVTQRYAERHPSTTERERVPAAPGPERNRSSGSGQFINNRQAAKNPRGSQREK